jgi:hypothetical protein
LQKGTLVLAGWDAGNNSIKMLNHRMLLCTTGNCMIIHRILCINSFWNYTFEPGALLTCWRVFLKKKKKKKDVSIKDTRTAEAITFVNSFHIFACCRDLLLLSRWNLGLKGVEFNQIQVDPHTSESWKKKRTFGSKLSWLKGGAILNLIYFSFFNKTFGWLGDRRLYQHVCASIKHAVFGNFKLNRKRVNR